MGRESESCHVVTLTAAAVVGLHLLGVDLGKSYVEISSVQVGWHSCRRDLRGAAGEVLVSHNQHRTCDDAMIMGNVTDTAAVVA